MDQIEKLISEIEALKTSLICQKEKNEKLESKNEKLESKNEKLESKNGKLESKNGKLKTEKDKLEVENEKLEVENEKLETENKNLEAENEKLQKLEIFYQEQLKLRQKEKFGKSSEKIDENQITLFELFNEVEELKEMIMPEPTEEILVPAHTRKKKRNKKETFKNLPVEVIEYKLTDDELECNVCGKSMHVMKKEIRKELKIIPAQVSIIEHVTYVYSCRNCETTGIEANIINAVSPKALIPKSLVSPSVLAYIMNQKYALSIPLYRQEQEWKRLGVIMSRQNLSNWIIKGANLLKPLYEELKKELVSNKILHADETTLEVLNEPGREAHTKSYMWLYATTKFSEKQVALYEYTTGRSGNYAKKFLENWKGAYLCCDGYIGYNKIESIKRCGCYAHLRRYFHDSYKVANCEKSKNCLDFLVEMFAYEKRADENFYTSEERLQMRKDKYPEILEKFYEYLNEISMQTLPKSLLGKAIVYAQNQKETFYTILEDGNIELTNSRSERFIKMFVIGRKNFLFSNTPNGANSSALIYSVIQTAIANNLKPMNYIQYVFEKIQANPQIDVISLLPWASDILKTCSNNS